MKEVVSIGRVSHARERDYEEADEIGRGVEERDGEIGRCRCQKMAASSNAINAATSMKWKNRLGLYGLPPTSCFSSNQKLR